MILGSEWMTRGWTYQEALLPRRRLIFTDQQVYFECQGLIREDSYVDNRDPRSCNGKSKFQREEFGRRPEDVFNYISEYSQRNLSNLGDYLNGLLDISTMLAECKRAIHHLFGVPILPQMFLDVSNGSIRRVERGYDCRLMIGMNWIVERGTRRRGQDFPSWTWVGWTGPVTWAWGGSESHVLGDFISEDSMKVVSNCKAWAESDKGKSFSLQSLCEPPDPSSRVDGSLLKVLHIESEVFDVKVVYLPGGLEGCTSRPAYWMNWESGGRLVHSRVHVFEYIDVEGISQPQRFKVLITGRDFQGWDSRRNHRREKGVERTHGKLLREVGEGYEVVGYVCFSCARLYVRDSSGALDEGELFLPKTVREHVRLV